MMRRYTLSAVEQILVKERVPDKCPFCAQEGVDWSEFGINIGNRLWLSKGQTEGGHRDHFIQVFCSRCEEEIREEDVNDTKD